MEVFAAERDERSVTDALSWENNFYGTSKTKEEKKEKNKKDKENEEKKRQAQFRAERARSWVKFGK
ncbi:hypothetical protein AGMMS49921_12310 [Endomicrobiia bacterium]|nr:hypothetical protein AGMMS49921_12310 [Endomicrobiia bacterium]